MLGASDTCESCLLIEISFTRSKTECETKVADLCAENDQLPKAAKIYEALAARTPRSGTNWAAPKHLWKAMLCHMVLESKSTGV